MQVIKKIENRKGDVSITRLNERDLTLTRMYKKDKALFITEWWFLIYRERIYLLSISEEFRKNYMEGL